MTITSMPKQHQLAAQAVRHALQGMLGCAVGPHKRSTVLPEMDDMLMMRPGGPFKVASAPSCGRKACKEATS